MAVPQAGAPLAGWHFDPWQRADYRYWDGSEWTAHVSRAGLQAIDEIPAGASRTDRSAVSGSGASTNAPAPRAVNAPANPTPPPAATADIPLWGARSKARELQGQLERAVAEAAAARQEAAALRANGDSLRAEVARLSRFAVLSAAELEQRRDSLAAEVAAQQVQLEQDRMSAAEATRREVAELTHSRDRLATQLGDLREQVVRTEEEAILQEVGVYRYRHPLSDAVAYQAELSRLRDRIKTMTRKDGGAVSATTNWTVDGSVTKGRTMVRDFSKLMLRAYNAEADNLVRGMKPYKLDSAIDRLTKVATTIAKLGRTMDIHISDMYHRARVKELELTADYLELQAQQKEREREERERLREEKRAQQEMERERARLEKERQHHANALAALVAKGDEEAASRLQLQLDEIDQRIDDVDYRAANVRAGYVYVISNVGSLGERIVKIGMTRRLDPLDRVRELGDASVPFKFDVHALFFSEDAVGIEAEMHGRLADRRVNLVNTRREFFYASPGEVKTHLLDLTGELLEYEEFPEAVEFRQSEVERPVEAASPSA